MTCISCKPRFECDDCVADLFGEIDTIDTRPDDRRAAAHAKFVELGAQVAWFREQLTGIAICRPHDVDAISEYRLRYSTAVRHRDRVWGWVLRWHGLVIERQRRVGCGFELAQRDV